LENFWFAVIPDIHLGREKVNIHFWDKAPEKEAVVGIGIEERLRKTVELINKDREIEFVITIGDLTDSGLPGQFEKARNILDKLKKPYIPIIGNHDIWPYQWDWQRRKVLWDAKKPLNVSEFEKYFASSLKVPWLTKQEDSLQNYSFAFRGTRFVVMDNVNRKHAPFGLPGTVAWAKLHKESKKRLERELELAEENRLIVFSHSPLKMGILENLLRQSPQVREIVSIGGHRHKITERKEKGVTLVTTNALYIEPKILKVLVSEKIRFQYQSLKGGKDISSHISSAFLFLQWKMSSLVINSLKSGSST
jgi:predicted phosphodiesterase